MHTHLDRPHQNAQPPSVLHSAHAPPSRHGRVRVTHRFREAQPRSSSASAFGQPAPALIAFLESAAAGGEQPCANGGERARQVLLRGLATRSGALS